MVKWLTRDSVLHFVVDDLLVFAFFFIPFFKFSPVAGGTITLCSLISIVASLFQGRSKEILRPNFVAALVLLFMVYTMVFSLPVLTDMKAYIRLEYQIRLPMLLLSVALLLRGFVQFQPRRAMVFFTLGSIVAALVVLIVYCQSLYGEFENIPYSFFNVQLCFQSVVGWMLHRTYMCFNLLTGLIVVYYLFSDNWTRKRMILFAVFYLFTAIFVVMSDARISLLTLLWITFFIFAKFLKRYMKGWQFYLAILSFIALLCLLCFQSTRINNLLITLFDGTKSLRELDPRFELWHCSWQAFLNSAHPWIGTGTGSASEYLQLVYHREDFVQAIASNWNPHNQFLEVLLENGLIGLILFMVMLMAPLFVKGRQRTFYLIWIPALCLNLFFESMLTRSIGTYTITTILLLAGLSDEKAYKPTYPTIRNIFLLLTLIPVVILSAKFIQKDKRNVFGTFQRYYERVDVLPGEVPDELKGSYGLKIDHTIKADVWREWAMTYQCFLRHSFKEEEKFHFTVYLYVSEDFDGDKFTMSYEERQHFGKELSYDFDKRGTWQKMELSGDGLYGNTVFLVTCGKKDCSDFSNMEGFAIFAQPTIVIK